MAKVRAFRTLENWYRRMGFNRVAGVDEVGRGCLAGPVVAAAVILDPERYVPRVCDSKTVTPLERERLYVKITRAAIAWGVAAAEPEEIDRINIHQAGLRAMQRAVSMLAPLPDCVLVDAFRIPDLLMPQKAVPHGDSRCTAIAAASIVAKVTRDRLMRQLHEQDERYGFDRHKGYATRDHLDAVTRFGYSAAHRRSFRPPSIFGDRLPSPAEFDDILLDPEHHESGAIEVRTPSRSFRSEPLARIETLLNTLCLDEARAAAAELLGQDADAPERLLETAVAVSPVNPEADFALVSIVTEYLLGRGNAGRAGAALQQFVARVPNHYDGLTKLVEVAGAAGWEAVMVEARCLLADACLSQSRPAEARVIAEELVAREPWERGHLDRLRRALMMLQVSDPEIVVADTLSGQAAFEHAGAAGPRIAVDAAGPEKGG
jgi:ribonuclease HII